MKSVCVLLAFLAVSAAKGEFNPVRYVKDALARGEKSICIPKGRYFVTPEGATETAYFRLENLRDTTIDFSGSDLVGTVRTRMFDLRACTNVTIRNVSLDFRELPFTQAVIEKVDAAHNWDVRVVKGYPCPNMAKKGTAIDNHDNFWPIQAYDGKTYELKNPMRYLDGVSIVQTGADTYRITGGKNRRGDVGDIAVWSVAEQGRPVEGENVNALNCADLVFEDITQYSTPHGRAFIDWSSSNTTYLRCRVVRRPPTEDIVPRAMPRLRSGNHDAFISKNAYVGPKIVDCVAEYHCDDCVNISGAYQVIYEGKEKEVRVFVHGAWDLQLAVGDSCQVLTPDGQTLPDVKVLKVREGAPIRPEESAYLETIGLWPGIAKAMRKSYVLTLDRAVDFPRGTLLASQNRMGNGFVIRGCRFGSTRARGLLVKASNGVIENCDVTQAVCFTTEYEWLSAGIANTVVMRNNRFHNGVFRGGRAAHNKPLSPDVNRGIVEVRPQENLWMWGHHPDALFAKGGTHAYGLPVVKCADMAEACRSMGIDGCFVVRWHNLPTKAELPTYMRQFKDMKQVGFSITDGAVEGFEEKVRLGLELAEKMPNLTTFVLDDYWAACGYAQPISRLRALKTELARRGLKLAVVLYSDTNGLKPEFREVLDLCDEVTYWFWNGKNVGDIEASVDRLRAFVGPRKPILLGQYMWDFGGRRAMPADLMRRQLDQTKRLLEAQKISGVIFHCTILAGLDLEAVRISKDWIRELQASRTGKLVVDDRLPAGNIICEKVEGDVVKVRQDVRDTVGGWFYWAMRVKGAAGRTLRFDFTDPYGGGPVGVRGPVVSTDRGQTYAYPLDGKTTANSFSWTFAPDQDEVWFYECHPYLHQDWKKFLDAHSALRDKAFVTDILCKSKKGADVPMARFGCLSESPRYRILLSSRHHCSETMATFALEGAAKACLGDDELGRWLRKNVELTIIPFVDYDGAQAGDQGKNRAPHDHNRDYTAWIYPETRALAALAKTKAFDMFFDIHCPWIRNKYNEWLYTPGKPSDLPYIDQKAEARFSSLLERLQCGSMRYRAQDDLPFGQSWNTGKNYAQGLSAVIWAGKNLPTLKICRTFEVPFANANGAVVTPTTCRDFGRDLVRCIRAFLTADEVSRP